MPDYDEITSLASMYGARTTDFYCLSAGHDPYYMVNNPYAMAKGEWFADLYQQYWHTLADKIVRSLHYAILHHVVYLPGDPPVRYINLDTHYEKLLDAAKIARYLHLVPMDVVEESKNEPDVFIPPIMVHPYLTVDAQAWSNTVEIESFPDKPCYRYMKFPYNQRYHIEIWCEKSYGPLKELARKYGAVFQQGQGEQTLACAHMLAERRKQYRRPVRVFYIADFDPAGTSMPLSVSRKLEYMFEEIRTNETEPDVRLYSIALTQEQVDRYQLPRTPLKSTEKRKSTWEAIHGVDAVELNALEAQPEYRGELIRIVEDAILNYYDPDLESAVSLAQSKFLEEVQGIQQNVYYHFPLQRLQREYNDLVSSMAPKLQKLNEEIEEVWERINEALIEEMPDLDNYLEDHPLPTAKIAQELDGPLYDSRRDYFNQLAVYKKHQGKRIVF